MMNSFLVGFYGHKVRHQHAYLPQRSSLSAWSDILNELDVWDNVFEFDLTGFFDNVSHSAIEGVLVQMGLPHDVVTEYMGLCRSVPVLCEDDLKPEPDRGIRYLSDGRPNPGYKSELHTGDYKTYGVPQGAAISCGLSILVNLYQVENRRVSVKLEDIHPASNKTQGSAGPRGLELEVNTRVIYFADDGISFQDCQPLALDHRGFVHEPSRGLLVQPKKSRIIKLGGR